MTKNTRDISHIRRHFKRVDPRIHAVLKEMPLEPLRPVRGTNRYFLKLCRDIVYQQLAGKAAAAIYRRFIDLFPSRNPSPNEVLAVPPRTLRACGLSEQKMRYLRDLAEKVSKKELAFHTFRTLGDEAVIAELVKVKGIGRWTAEMFLIFTLGREDVFSFGDFGLAKGLEMLYGKKRVDSERKVRRITERWAPYRSYGSLATWYAKDGE